MLLGSGCGASTTQSKTTVSVVPPTTLVQAAQRIAPQMQSAALRAVAQETAALSGCPAAERFDLVRLDPLRLAALYKAVAQTYASISRAAQRAHGIDPALRRAITRRSRQLALFRDAHVSPCPILRVWVSTGVDSDAPLYRGIGVSRKDFPPSRNGRGDPAIHKAVEALRTRGYSSEDIQRLRLTLDPVLNSLH